MLLSIQLLDGATLTRAYKSIPNNSNFYHSMTNQNFNPRKPAVVWWVIWAAFLIGIVQIYFILGKSSVAPATATSLDFLALAPFVVASLVRWVALPKIQLPQVALVVFILGIAIAESSCFLGLFIFRAHKTELFALSVLGIAQFAPVFARKYAS
jgi:hypothetical protein